MKELECHDPGSPKRARIGRLIVVEGPNEVGKTTVSRALANWLKMHGSPSEVQSFPGRSLGSLGNHVYKLHHAPLEFGIEELSSTALQAMHIAAHLDAIERMILPKLASGIDVVLDRYWWSTMVYGIATGVSQRILESLIATELLAWQDRVPALVVVLEREMAISHSEKADYFSTLRAEYRRLVEAARERHPACIIRNDGTVNQTITEIVSVLDRDRKLS